MLFFPTVPASDIIGADYVFAPCRAPALPFPVADETFCIIIGLSCTEKQGGLTLGAFKKVGSPYASIDYQSMSPFSSSNGVVFAVGEPIKAPPIDTSLVEA